MSIDDRLDLSSIQIVDGEFPAGKLGPDDELLPSEEGKPMRFRRKVIKQKEVPFKRKVKVPVVTKEVVECSVEKRVPVKKYVEVQAYEEVEETYTEFENVTKQREKKIWREVEEVKEETRKRPVQKFRTVKRPIITVVEEEIEQTVVVPGTKIEEVQGWRVDQTVVYKDVQVEDWEVYELIPHSTGEYELKETRELGRVETSELSRTIGHSTWTQRDIDEGRVTLDNVQDDWVNSAASMQQQAAMQDGYYSTPAVLAGDEQQAIEDGSQKSRRQRKAQQVGEGSSY